MNLSDGILRAVYREGFERVVPLVPGEPAELRVELFPTANRFETGHRIRVEIASSNFPRFDVNPQAEPGDDLSQVRHVAHNALLLGPDHPTRLELWVLP
jgi:predicted acyl esterase